VTKPAGQSVHQRRRDSPPLSGQLYQRYVRMVGMGISTSREVPGASMARIWSKTVFLQGVAKACGNFADVFGFSGQAGLAAYSQVTVQTAFSPFRHGKRPDVYSRPIFPVLEPPTRPTGS